MNLRLKTLSITAALLFCGAAQAGGMLTMSTMSSSGKRMISVVEYLSPGNLRVSPAMQASSYLVLRDGRPYAMTANSETLLTDFSSADTAGAVRPNTGDETVASIISLRKTTQTERRAGFIAPVYEITYTDTSGKQRREEAVLSDDPRAREFTAVWKSINDAFYPGGASMPASADLQKQLQEQGLGLLRFGPWYQVDAFASNTPDAARLNIAPAPVAVAAPVLVAAPVVEEAAPVAVPEAAEAAIAETPAREPRGLLGLLFGGGSSGGGGAAPASESEPSRGLFGRVVDNNSAAATPAAQETETAPAPATDADAPAAEPAPTRSRGLFGG